MRSFSIVLSLVLVLCLSGVSFAEELKIATVNIDRVLNESSTAKAKRKFLDKLSLDAKKKVSDRRTALKKLQERVEESGDAKSKDADRLRSDAKDFARYVRDTEDSLRREFAKSNKEIMDKALSVIDKYAKANSIDLILADSEAAKGPLLFSDASTDITDAIISNLEK